MLRYFFARLICLVVLLVGNAAQACVSPTSQSSQLFLHPCHVDADCAFLMFDGGILQVQKCGQTDSYIYYNQEKKYYVNDIKKCLDEGALYFVHGDRVTFRWGTCLRSEVPKLHPFFMPAYTMQYSPFVRISTPPMAHSRPSARFSFITPIRQLSNKKYNEALQAIDNPVVKSVVLFVLKDTGANNKNT